MSSPTRPHANSTRRPWLLLAVITACLAGACATNQLLDHARLAEQQQDYDRAVLEYGKLVKLHPDDNNFRLALNRTKLRAAEDHYTRGRRLASAGKYEQALIELQLASELAPANGDIDMALRQARAAFKNRIAVSREGKTQLETIIDHAREFPSPGFDLPRDLKLPSSVVFSEASSKTRHHCARPAAQGSTWSSIPRSARLRSRSICTTQRSRTRSPR